MELILWRHADAESGIPDEARPLSDRGRQEAARMGEWLRARLPRGTRVMVSPARRAQETARALTDAYETSSALGTLSTPVAVLEAAGWPHASAAVVVVGHQPTLGQTAALALTGRVADFDLEKGAMCWLVRDNRKGKTRVRGIVPPELI